MARDATVAEYVSVPLGILLELLVFMVVGRSGAWSLFLPASLGVALVTLAVGRSRRTEVAVLAGLLLWPLHVALDRWGWAIDAGFAPALTVPVGVASTFLALHLLRSRRRVAFTLAAAAWCALGGLFVGLGTATNGCWGPPHGDSVVRNAPLALALFGSWTVATVAYARARLGPPRQVGGSGPGGAFAAAAGVPESADSP